MKEEFGRDEQRSSALFLTSLLAKRLRDLLAGRADGERRAKQQFQRQARRVGFQTGNGRLIRAEAGCQLCLREPGAFPQGI